jgi:hypothetical protein
MDGWGGEVIFLSFFFFFFAFAFAQYPIRSKKRANQMVEFWLRES